MADGAIAGNLARPAPALAAQIDLFRELGDLKRVRSAGKSGSIAERLFAGAWTALVRGEHLHATMRRVVAAALAAARLGDLDLTTLAALGVPHDAAVAVLQRGFGEVAGPVEAGLAAELRGVLAHGAPSPGAAPDFTSRLAAQPRAGVTCPGRRRLLLQPAENHAEHSLMVAVYAVLISPLYAADPGLAFLAGLAHHLHNAAMPDCGFTGEVLLGDWLDRVVASAREPVLAELPPRLAAEVRMALAPITDDVTPEARAFHAADVIDRVLEIDQHFAAANLGAGDVLNDYRLVHDGPVKAFHDRVLRNAGLA